MAEDLINFDLPVERSSIIKVIGVGGGGSNAVNHMYTQGIKDVNFVVCNTDAQALENSPVSVKIQLGASLTEGRGAGNKPEIGRQAAIENIDEVVEVLESNTKMVFITAGMGGGTGTGAAPVIAKAAKEQGILTVAIVTIPFRNEGQRRISQALEGISELEKHVDSLLVINNEKIREIYGDLKVSEAFSRADDVLAIAARGIAEIITVHGYINVDFADVETVMTNSGVAIMGSALAEGENRAINAVQEALSSPLLNNNDIKGARNILLNITSGTDEVTMDEIGQITDYIQAESGSEADLIWGNGVDESLGEKLCVTVIATGFEAGNSIPELYLRKKPEKDKVVLDEEKPSTGRPERKPVDQPEFVVQQKKEDKRKKDEKSRMVEFDFSSSDEKEELVVRERKNTNNEIEFYMDTQKAENRLNAIKRTQAKFKEAGYNSKDDRENIEELENEPAYVRKQIKIDSKQQSKDDEEVSRYTLSEDDDFEIRLRPDNSYLHDNVD
ncbi:MAG: cell division protein FtsZ [Bacteroidota bacterium]